MEPRKREPGRRRQRSRTTVLALCASIGTDCSIQDYSSVAVLSHGFTMGTATARVTQHCAGNAAPPAIVPTFAASGANFDCDAWTVEDGAGTIVWALPTEEPTTFVQGDGANAFRFED